MMHRYTRFQISSEQCEILLNLREVGSVQRLAETLGRDVSAINRQLQKIATLGDFLEKKEGRWQVSSLGYRVAEWTRESISQQFRLLNAREEVRVVTTREFAARVLAPQMADLLTQNPDVHVVLLSSEEGIEPWLLSDRADIGLDCGAPQDPSLRYRGVQKEPYSAVASPEFLAKYKLSKRGNFETEELQMLPHLQFLRRSSAALMPSERELNIVATFNDLAALRAACCAGLGWALIPSYCVKSELKSKSLVEIPFATKPAPEKFGVWWMRERKSMDHWARFFVQWLEKQDLT